MRTSRLTLPYYDTTTLLHYQTATLLNYDTTPPLQATYVATYHAGKMAGSWSLDGAEGSFFLRHDSIPALLNGSLA